MDRQQLRATLPSVDSAGVFSLPAGRSGLLVEVATALGLAVFRVSLAGCSDKDAVLARLAERLDFPEWFGQNWEALADCLTDFSWREAPGYVLLVEDLNEFRTAADDDFDTLIEILSDASASWGGLGIPFWGFLVLDD